MTRIAFDMSSVMWTCLSVGKDTEHGYAVPFGDEKVWVNTCAYGYDNAVASMAAALNKHGLAPKDAILVFEGMHSKKRRLMIDPAYKEGRGSRPPEAYEEFQKLKDKLTHVFRNLGSIILTQDYVEGDDILAWLAQEMEDDLIIRSGDGDLAALNGTNAHGAAITVHIGDDVGLNKFGPFQFKHIVVYKSLVGDSSDNIKGCPGFGPKSFLQFYADYGDEGLDELLRLMEQNKLQELAANAEEDKLVKKIYDQREQVLKSYRVAKLRPEWVNTLSHPLKWKAGLTLPAGSEKDERLLKWYGQTFLVTGDKFESAIAWARPFIEASEFVGLDIETTTPDDSDEWLANQSKSGKAEGVDVIASTLVGLSITFGRNMEKTLYFSVHHAETNNCNSLALCDFVVSIKKPFVIQNAAGFELPVLSKEWGDHLAQQGQVIERFLPGALDTRIEAVYVNENLPEFGLKFMSREFLDYKQVDYTTVTTVQEGVDEAGAAVMVQKKMHQLSAKHVLSYACDDTITCSGLHNWFMLMMQLEHQWHVYLETEIDSMYLGAHAYVTGVPMSMKRLKALEREDQETHDAAWAKFRPFLIENGWEGTVPPTYTTAITAAEAKEAYQIVTGTKLETTVRLIEKLALAAEAAEHPLFAHMLRQCVQSREGAEKFTAWVRSYFKGEPVWKMSPKQKSVVLYDVLKLPVRLRNEATDLMRAAGQTEGNPKTDALALAYAVKYDAPERPEIAPVIEALRVMQTVETRQGLYYKPYPSLIHWLTGRLHPQIRQSSTNTRRATAAKPNTQQMSKHEKIEGDMPRVREVIVPHKRNAVVVSMDFKSQELVVIADYSWDENMVACFVGDNKKDMHALTGLKILQDSDSAYADYTYEKFAAVLEDPTHPDYTAVKKARNLGKRTNFTSEFGAMAPKLAEVLLETEENAQRYLDAKEAMFPGVRRWKDSVEEEAQQLGFVRTKCGAVRHLADALMSSDRYESSKALRQAVNFKVQSSSAEMTKKACGAAWRARLLERFDCQFYFPVHDEVVWSCAIEDLFEFIPALHACMVQAYGDMKIPIGSAISFGKSFGPEDQIEIGSVPSREAIAEGIEKWQKSTQS